MTTQIEVKIDTEALRRALEPSLDTGQASAGGAATLTDNTKEWVVNAWANYLIELTEGAGKGEFRRIASNTATVITVAPAWTAGLVPDASTHYRITPFGILAGAITIPYSVDIPRELAHGTATAGGANTLTDATAGINYDVNAFAGCLIRILDGTGAGQSRRIASNTATVITITNAWAVNPAAGSIYTIEPLPPVDIPRELAHGVATAGGANTLTDATAGINFDVNAFEGCLLKILAGPGAGQSRVIESNTATVITVSNAWAVNPAAGSIYTIEPLPDPMLVLTAVHRTYVSTDDVVNQDVWTPAAGKRFVMTDFKLSTNEACVVQLLDEAAVIETFYFGSYGGCVSNQRMPYRSAAINQDLKLTTTGLSASGHVSISVDGKEE